MFSEAFFSRGVNSLDCADDKNVPEKLKFVLGRAENIMVILKVIIGWVENIMGKGENAGYQHFLLFP